MFVEVKHEVPIVRTARVLQMAGQYDLPVEETHSRFGAKVEIPDDFQILLITGSSGVGKSSVARQVWGDKVTLEYDWPADKSVLDGFGEHSIKDITAVLSSVGFNTIPNWLRPYRVLSTGEKFRVNVARAILDTPTDPVVIDEFTSVVDRQTAQIGSAAIAKAVRGMGRKFVAVSCHRDIIEWLQPDCVLDMDTRILERGLVWQGPTIELEITRVHWRIWELFRPHHYIDQNLNRSCKCFLATCAGRPAVFVASIVHPTADMPMGSTYRESRLVCMPDFQGLGLGHLVSDLVASLFAACGKRYWSRTSHPSMKLHRPRYGNWRVKTKAAIGGGTLAPRMKMHLQKRQIRLVETHEYCGAPYPDREIATCCL